MSQDKQQDPAAAPQATTPSRETPFVVIAGLNDSERERGEKDN